MKRLILKHGSGKHEALRNPKRDSQAASEEDNASDPGLDISRIQKDRLFIARNNLKLNVFINLFLMACLGLVFSLDWYCYEQPSDASVINAFLTLV